MPVPVPCNLCGSKDALPLFRTHDRLLDLPGRYCLVQCQRCGLVYVNPQPTWDERAAHYAVEYRGYHHLEAEPSSLQRWGMRYGLHKRWRIVSRYASGGRLLDVGCGSGDWVHWMHRIRGWLAYGLERVAEVASLARQQCGARVVIGDLTQLGFSRASFDVVTLWTVLEHLADPRQGLTECARVLREGGLLVLRTVTAASWGAHWFGPCWLGYDAPRILYAFSPRTLHSLLEQTGVTVLHTGYYFHDFHPFVWSLSNLCAARIRRPRLCRTIEHLIDSWPVRLATWPLFALQTLMGGDSFVTLVARKV
jgi:ubiquinone/menaquinone biosynthesis C-methylase UbiE